jgi:hypothetical protein
MADTMNSERLARCLEGISADADSYALSGYEARCIAEAADALRASVQQEVESQQEDGEQEASDWLERIIWDAVWHNKPGDPPEEFCSWDHALEYEEEFGTMVPETIRAAGRIRSHLFLDARKSSESRPSASNTMKTEREQLADLCEQDSLRQGYTVIQRHELKRIAELLRASVHREVELQQGVARDLRNTAAKLLHRAGSREDDDARFMVRMALACDQHVKDLGYYSQQVAESIPTAAPTRTHAEVLRAISSAYNDHWDDDTAMLFQRTKERVRKLYERSEQP